MLPVLQLDERCLEKMRYLRWDRKTGATLQMSDKCQTIKVVTWENWLRILQLYGCHIQMRNIISTSIFYAESSSSLLASWLIPGYPLHNDATRFPLAYCCQKNSITKFCIKKIWCCFWFWQMTISLSAIFPSKHIDTRTYHFLWRNPAIM